MPRPKSLAHTMEKNRWKFLETQLANILSSVLHISCQSQEIMIWCLPSVLEQIMKPSGEVSFLINSPDFYKGIHLISPKTFESGCPNLSPLSRHPVKSTQRNNTSRKWFIPYKGKRDALPSDAFPAQIWPGASGRLCPTLLPLAQKQRWLQPGSVL